jgi:hypothetical protein
LVSLLRAPHDTDPQIRQILREERREFLEVVRKSYSQAAAYVLLLIRVEWELRDLADLLWIGVETLRKRIARCADLAGMQPTLFDGIDHIDPDFTPTRRARTVRAAGLGRPSSIGYPRASAQRGMRFAVDACATRPRKDRRAARRVRVERARLHVHHVEADLRARLPMNAADYQAKLIACELTRRFPPDSGDKLAGAVANAQVDLNPHQMDAARRLLGLPGEIIQTDVSVDETPLGNMATEQQSGIQRAISERNARYFEAEVEKLDGWADDLKVGLEREIKDLDRQIKEARHAARSALTLEEKLAVQKQIKALEAQRSHKRKSLFEAQDRVDAQRDEMIAKVEGRLQQSASATQLFLLRWQLG